MPRGCQHCQHLPAPSHWRSGANHDVRTVYAGLFHLFWELGALPVCLLSLSMPSSLPSCTCLSSLLVGVLARASSSTHVWISSPPYLEVSECVCTHDNSLPTVLLSLWGTRTSLSSPSVCVYMLLSFSEYMYATVPPGCHPPAVYLCSSSQVGVSLFSLWGGCPPPLGASVSSPFRAHVSLLPILMGLVNLPIEVRMVCLLSVGLYLPKHPGVVPHCPLHILL